MNTIWEAIKVSEHADTAFLLHGSISDAFPPDKQGPVSTFHAAKGLEFRALHLAACDELKSFGNNRRMAFTAVTRAKTALSVYHCDDLHGYFEAALQSLKPVPDPPTLDEIFGGSRRCTLWSCDRRRFVDFIANRKPLGVADVRSADNLEEVPLRGDAILLIWKKSPAEKFSLPRAAIVAEGSLQHFLAWVLTYFRHIRPFTAHCRVLTPSSAMLAAQSIPSQSLLDMRSADIGLILAEGIAYSVGRTDLNRLPYSAFERTLSFAYAEGAKRYQQVFARKGATLEQVTSGWMEVRELTNQSSLDLSPADIREVWALVLNAVAAVGSNRAEGKSEHLVVDALRGVRANGRIPGDIWTQLSDSLLGAESLIRTMEGPREGRVKAAEITIRELSNGPPETQRCRAFIAGYMTSCIQPGSLDHFSILFPVIAKLRESFLWYGVCFWFDS